MIEKLGEKQMKWVIRVLVLACSVLALSYTGSLLENNEITYDKYYFWLVIHAVLLLGYLKSDDFLGLFKSKK